MPDTPPGLEAELEAALLDAMQGDAWGPGLKGRLELAARRVLYGRGFRSVRVTAVLEPDGAVRVVVRLPPGPRRVREIRLRLAPG